MIRAALDDAGLAIAAQALRDGAVVAIPTDTAYGLAARPDCRAALEAIFAIKRRPPNQPLILLGETQEQFRDWVTIPAAACPLIERFWPGALTLVLEAGPLAQPPIATPEGTVGIRIPAHARMLALLSEMGPLATTSANLTGLPSPRSANDVADQIGSHRLLAVLLDGGPTAHAEDSTVLSLVDGSRIIRQGAIPAAELASALGRRAQGSLAEKKLGGSATGN